MSFHDVVHAKAIELVRTAVDMTTEAGSGHPTSAASLAHLVTVLMYDHMRYDPLDPDRIEADRLVLSEGHACPIVYAAAADLGMPARDENGDLAPLDRERVLRLRELHSPVEGHPSPAEGFGFFPAATGSLGQGLSVCAGLALAARHDGRDDRFFCLIGDGESREGQIAEALDFVVENDLRSVCAVFNCNRYGQTGRVGRPQRPEALAAKLEAAGFEVVRIDGHDPDEVRRAFERHAEAAEASDDTKRPVAIVAETIKGWGFEDLIEGGLHGKALDDEQREKAHRALSTRAEQLGATWEDGILSIESPATGPGPRREPESPPADLRAALEAFGEEDALEDGLATRKAYGHALRALGRSDPSLMVLDAEVSNSTYAETFEEDEKHTDRFFECRIAEQNMVGCAVGLAAAGKRPFLSTFGKFLTRAYDQIEMAMIGEIPLRMMGSHVGVTLAADGPSQMALADVAFFHAYTKVRRHDDRPMLHVLFPADAYAAYGLTLAMAAHDGATYMRTLRPDTPLLYGPDDRFELGGHRVVEEGDDVLVLASGYMVHEARDAVRKVRDDGGPSCTLVDLYSLPFDEDAIAELADRHGGRVLTVEDNYAGGMGSAVADALASRGVGGRLEQMVTRSVPRSGRTPDAVLEDLGLDAGSIAERIGRLRKASAAGA